MKSLSLVGFLIACGTAHAAEQVSFDALEGFLRAGAQHYAKISAQKAGATSIAPLRIERDECRESKNGYRCLFQAGTAGIMADGPARNGSVRSFAVVTDNTTAPRDAIAALGMVAASIEPTAGYEEWALVQSTWSQVSEAGFPGHVYLGGTIVYYAFGRNGALLTSFSRPNGLTR